MIDVTGRLPDELTEPRHLAAALAVGLLVQAAAAGAVGFASAGAGGAEMPDRLTVPEPWPGDRVNYTISAVQRTDDGLEVVKEPATWARFVAEPDGTERGGDGEVHSVYRFDRSVDFDPFDWEGRRSTREVTYDRSSRQMVSHSTNGTYENPTSSGSILRDEEDVIRNSWRGVAFPWSKRDCVLVHGLQGRTIDTDATVDPMSGCSYTFQMRDNLSLATVHWPTLEATGVQRLGPWDTVVFEGRSEEGAEVKVWLSPSSPYPVRVAVEDPRRPGRFHVRDLAGLDRGDEPYPDSPATGTPLPAIEGARRRRHGPSETGVEHPFPLSEAFQRARSDDSCGLDGFLDDRPKAYTVSAHHARWVYDTNRTDEWRFAVTDGDRTLRIVATRIEEPATVVWPRNGPRSSPANRTDHRFGCSTEDAGSVPQPTVLPDRIPTVASLSEVWRSVAHPSVAEKGANTWSFKLESLQRIDGPDTAGVKISVGRIRYEDTRGFPDARTRHQAHERSLMTVYSRFPGLPTDPWIGSIISQDYSWNHTDHRVGGSGDTEGSDPPETAGDLAPTGSGIWSLSPRAAAGIGLVAALTGILYWLWPVVKQGGLVSLSTRLTKEDALDHPVRRELMDRIEAEPGVHRNALIDALGAGNGAVRHHLDMLVELDHVVETRGQGYACYFPAGGVGRRVMDAAPALRSGSARRILEAVVDEPGLSNGEVAARTGLSPSTVSHHVARLQEADLVDADRAGRELELRPTDLADRAVDELAV